jgi:hypothetical protein
MDRRRLPVRTIRSTLTVLALLGSVLLAACARESAKDQPASVSRTATAASTQVVGHPVRDDGLVATWFAPVDTRPGPALLVLGGSEGGKETGERMAHSLHAEGYATLALAYFGDEGLPQQLQNVPLEYFVRALDWLARQPGVDAARIGVIGGSKGAEAALLLASRDARVRAVIASTPTDHAWQSVDWNGWSDTPSWTEHGEPVPYLRYAPFDMQAGLREMYDRSVAEAARAARDETRIPIERANAALLLIAGEDDGLWGAVEASNRIATSLAAAGYPHEVALLRYAGAGHVVFIGRSIADGDPLLQRFAAMGMGGTLAGTQAAINDSWPKALGFLRRNLGARDEGVARDGDNVR